MKTLIIVLLFLIGCTHIDNKGYIVKKTFIPHDSLFEQTPPDEYNITVVDTVNGHLNYYKSVDIPQRIFFNNHYGDFVYLDSLK